MKRTYYFLLFLLSILAYVYLNHLMVFRGRINIFLMIMGSLIFPTLAAVIVYFGTEKNRASLVFTLACFLVFFSAATYLEYLNYYFRTLEFLMDPTWSFFTGLGRTIGYNYSILFLVFYIKKKRSGSI